MNIRIASLCVGAALAFALAPSARAADSASMAQYSLNQGTIHISVPVGWNAMMQKTAGDPQLYAFQVPNAKSPDTLTRVTVRTQHVGSMANFGAYVKQQMIKAQRMDHYQLDVSPGGGTNEMRFRAENDGEELRFRESFYYKAGLAVTLRCVSPQHNPANAAWKRAYRQACESLAAQLAQ